MKDKIRMIVVVLAISSIVLLGFGCSNSSYEKSQEVLEKYPGAELYEVPRWGNVYEFLVRDRDGNIRKVVFSDKGKMCTDRIIFHGSK